MEVRGFDSYEISLGDEMRGERASLGKSLEDVERDLRIKAKVIVAIENCDLTGFTNQSVIAGYVRSYAKYLGLDADDCYARFCAESGYRSPAAMMVNAGPAYGTGRAETAGNRAGLAESRFATPPGRNRFRARISLGAITSGLALVVLVAGLSYGGFALLQDIQRVGFAPLPEAPSVVADAPRIDSPEVSVSTDDTRPDANAYAGGGTLAPLRAPLDLPVGPRPRRDGPIASIDPRRASVFSNSAPKAPSDIAAGDTTVNAAMLASRSETWVDPMAPDRLAVGPDRDLAARATARVAGRINGPAIGRLDTVVPTIDFGPEAESKETAESGIALLAVGEAWVEVSDRDNSVVYTGTMKPGQEVRLPDQILSPKLVSGNAGGTYLIVDGVAYGPLGGRGEVRRNFALTHDGIRQTLPQADLVALRTRSGSGPVTEVDPVAHADEKIVMPPRRPER